MHLPGKFSTSSDSLCFCWHGSYALWMSACQACVCMNTCIASSPSADSTHAAAPPVHLSNPNFMCVFTSRLSTLYRMRLARSNTPHPPLLLGVYLLASIHAQGSVFKFKHKFLLLSDVHQHNSPIVQTVLSTNRLLSPIMLTFTRCTCSWFIKTLLSYITFS